MGLLVGSLGLLRTPHASFPFSNPLSSSVLTSQRKAARTRSLLPTCRANGESHADAVVTPPRRALLLAGISTLPFLTLGAMAADVVLVQGQCLTKAALLQDLQNERKLVEELRAQISQLESSITRIAAEKNILEAKFKEKVDNVDVLQDRAVLLGSEINDKEKKIESLKVSLSENESECKKLSSNFEQLKNELALANSTIQQLKEELLGTKAELNSKISLIDSLNEKIQSLSSEKDNCVQRIEDIMKDYDDLKISSDRRAAHDAELLSKKEDQIRDIEEKLELATAEGSDNNAIIAELRKEKDDLKALLEREASTAKILKDELQSTQEVLGASKFEASNLSKDLDEARGSYEKLMTEVSKIQDDFSETKKMLAGSLEGAKSNAKLLSVELISHKAVLKKTKEELDITSKELKNAVADHENLKKELVETYKRLEAAMHEVNEEKKVVSSLNRELDVLGNQMETDAEARRALEADLYEATKSLDEMNESALLLSKEVESSNSRNNSLEAEKEMLLKSVTEQKKVAKEAQENIEDAQNLIMRLGGEKENLEKRAKKFGEELASAKGEILRLRRQISVGKESVDELQPKSNEVAAGAPFSVRKTASRRRKRRNA
ncbi:hypothetical protein BHE74_00011217 [Ensete ventricosum]|uniref:MAR-binding filament-like protein 1-1 n=1 Tax=Ensete ventricosum TaxID=4639 RepID=A0A445M8G7_ENSVE|nr:hypothetical protein BHE74_00011217 [Ensete ventricosum]RZR70535.1 hypothetical protein BHM03_00000387 [Ensete ventricosum]